ncbi:hypothetical protein Srot_0892 [Segniliparus rotundus DSM 44985]|uniref:Uncharacterized protein n=1 Tax=Segniliparus rotundus (strain ATCC BAA-972 / CDC 1076 / CIP 108378 / DSM 44985 / JCM 13578) TaxID=640132 RepID=D6ZE89_SEGRD|nr:hypothetical protein [Segniliparus rotundus]ADG97369.1 hypothetical protein Srot_0892 [Segniliparus rotundus DSM 44985]
MADVLSIVRLRKDWRGWLRELWFPAKLLTGYLAVTTSVTLVLLFFAWLLGGDARYGDHAKTDAADVISWVLIALIFARLIPTALRMVPVILVVVLAVYNVTEPDRKLSIGRKRYGAVLTSLKWVVLALVTLAVRRMVEALITTHAHDHDQYPVKLFVDVGGIVFIALMIGIVGKASSVNRDFALVTPEEKWAGVMRSMSLIDPYLKPPVLRLLRLAPRSVLRLRRTTLNLTSNQVGFASILAVVLLWLPLTVVIWAFLWALIP